MSSNYEWQKFQANERVQARLQEAEAHRLAQAVSNDRPLFTLPLTVKFRVLRPHFESLLSLMRRRMSHENQV